MEHATHCVYVCVTITHTSCDLFHIHMPLMLLCHPRGACSTGSSIKLMAAIDCEAANTGQARKVAHVSDAAQ